MLNYLPQIIVILLTVSIIVVFGFMISRSIAKHDKQKSLKKKKKYSR